MTGFLKLKLSFQLTVVVLILGAFGSLAFSRDVNRLPCKKLPDGVTRKQLIEDFEKFRKGETTINDSGPLGCEEALPVFRKYVIDPEPKIRAIVTLYLGSAYYEFNTSFYPKVLALLMLQVQNFPFDKGEFPPSYAANYPCYFFKKFNGKQLTNSLIHRILYRNKEYNRDEIYLLGCISRREPKAKDFLMQMSQPSFSTGLSEDDRRNQIENITYALAEAGEKAAEEKVLADIDSVNATVDADRIQGVLDDAKSFTNCRIVKRYISLIKDTRQISKAEYQNGEIRQLTGRVGDIAVSQFTSAYGTKATGEQSVSFRGHSDAELQKIYSRVKSFARKNVTGPCDFDK